MMPGDLERIGQHDKFKVDVRGCGHEFRFEKVPSAIVLDVDPGVYAWRAGPESISPQGVHGLEVDVRGGAAGPDEQGIGNDGTGLRLMGRDVEVQIVPK